MAAVASSTTRASPRTPPAPAASRARARMAALTDRAPLIVGVVSSVTLLLGARRPGGRAGDRRRPGEAAQGTYAVVEGAAETAQALGLLADRPRLHTVRHLGPPRLQGPVGPPHHRHPVGRRHLLAARRPPLRAALLRRARRARPDLAHGHLDPRHRRAARPLRALPGQRAGRRGGLAAASPSVRKRVALLTYGSPLERLYGRWFPAHFGPGRAQRPAPRGRLLAQPVPATDPIGGPVRLPGDCGPQVDREALKDPLAYGRTAAAPAARADPGPLRLPGRPGLRRGAGTTCSRG